MAVILTCITCYGAEGDCVCSANKPAPKIRPRSIAFANYVEIGTIWLHIKSQTRYVVLQVARLEKDGYDGEEQVVYRKALRLPGQKPKPESWVRPIREFLEKFQFVEPSINGGIKKCDTF